LPGNQQSNPDQQSSIQDSTDDAFDDEPGTVTLTDMKTIEN
jgi:hypothetical protein